MKQINIFNEIDYIDDQGKIQRCFLCNKSIEKGDFCLNNCNDPIIFKYFPIHETPENIEIFKKD